MNSQNPGLQQQILQFEKALSLLQQAIEKLNLTAVERAGLVQFFEICCQLSGDLLKNFAEGKGDVVKSPREAVECALGVGLVKDAEGWFTLLQDQWMTSEIYEEATARIVEENIRMKYFPLLAQLHHEFSIMMKEKE